MLVKSPKLQLSYCLYFVVIIVSKMLLFHSPLLVYLFPGINKVISFCLENYTLYESYS